MSSSVRQQRKSVDVGLKRVGRPFTFLHTIRVFKFETMATVADRLYGLDLTWLLAGSLLCCSAACMLGPVHSLPSLFKRGVLACLDFVTPGGLAPLTVGFFDSRPWRVPGLLVLRVLEGCARALSENSGGFPASLRLLRHGGAVRLLSRRS